MKIKHYSLFSIELASLIHPDSWRKLRDDPGEPAYYIPETVEAYREKFGGESPTPMAGAVIKVAKELGLRKVFSPGCGNGGMEYSIKEHSDLAVTVADYNDSLFRLREFGVFDGCEKLDLIEGSLPDLSDRLTILPRIDTEFTDDQLRRLASRLADAGARHVFFIPAQMIDWKTPLIELKIWLRALLGGRKRTFCGYSRSKGLLVSLFAGRYDFEELPVGQVRVLMFRIREDRRRG